MADQSELEQSPLNQKENIREELLNKRTIQQIKLSWGREPLRNLATQTPFPLKNEEALTALKELRELSNLLDPFAALGGPIKERQKSLMALYGLAQNLENLDPFELSNKLLWIMDQLEGQLPQKFKEKIS